MVQKMLDRIPDHKLTSLEDELRLHGHSMAADEISKTRFRRTQMRAASVENNTIISNNTKNGDIHENNNIKDDDALSSFINQLEDELQKIKHRGDMRRHYPEDIHFVSTPPFNGRDTTDCPRCSHTWKRSEISWDPDCEGFSGGREGYQTPMPHHYICANCNLRLINENRV